MVYKHQSLPVLRMAIMLQIHAFPPGAPTIYSLLSTSTSLTINIHLSPEGISPILSIAVNFTSPAGYVRSIPGPFSPGQLVTETLSDLEAETEYNFTLFAVNFNGLSPASALTNSRTGMCIVLNHYECIE